MKPPNETSGTCDAACSESELANRLATELGKINRGDVVTWQKHAQWMLGLYQLTKDKRHVDALRIHLSAVRERCQI
jgi:hypothetical protein